MKIVSSFLPLLALALLLLCTCCNNESTPTFARGSVEYLHIAHTRTWANPAMVPIIETFDYSPFDMLWLGGDLAFKSSEDDATMTHIDSIFDLKNPNTLLSLGNHDYDDLKRVQRFTQRPPYYTQHKNGITFLVLDTQDSLTSIIGQQKELFLSVTDSIQKSSHLVVLHHKLLWLRGHPELEPRIKSISNGPKGGCFFCINPNNFYSDLYPELLKVKQRGIEVICIGGDIGRHTKEFEFTTPEGIVLLASGVESDQQGNKGLVFKHDLDQRSLSWEYRVLEK